jgi:DNA-binding PadR family transcriptional regulator
MQGLTAFQFELLAELHRHAPIHGLGLRETWQERYGEGLNHSRLYINLDDLVDAGLVDKTEADKRTNHYALTDEGVGTLHDRVANLGGSL